MNQDNELIVVGLQAAQFVTDNYLDGCDLYFSQPTIDDVFVQWVVTMHETIRSILGNVWMICSYIITTIILPFVAAVITCAISHYYHRHHCRVSVLHNDAIIQEQMLSLLIQPMLRILVRLATRAFTSKLVTLTS